MTDGRLDVEFVDRYTALGIPYPDPETMCPGPCEGIGFYPLHSQGAKSEIESRLWAETHEKAHTFQQLLRALAGARMGLSFWFDIRFAFREWWRCDGWHFIKCPDCHGTGKKTA